MRRGKGKLIVLLLFVLIMFNCGCSIVLPRADTAAASIVGTMRSEGMSWEISFIYKNAAETIDIKGEGELYTSTQWTKTNGKTEIKGKSLEMSQEFKTETQNESQTRYIYSNYANKWYKETTNADNATNMLANTISNIGKKTGRVSRRTELFEEKSCYYASMPTDNVVLLWMCLFPTQYSSLMETEPFTDKELESSYAVCFIGKENTEIIGVSLRARAENEELTVNLKPQEQKSAVIESTQANDKRTLTKTDNPLSKDWELIIDESIPLVETPYAKPQEDDIEKAKAYSVYEKVFYFNGKPLSIPCTSESVINASLQYPDNGQSVIAAGETKSVKCVTDNGDVLTLLLTNNKKNEKCSYAEATVTGIVLYAESLTNTEVIMPGGIVFGENTEETGRLFQETPETIMSRDKLYKVMIYSTQTAEYSLSFYAEQMEGMEIICKTW